MTEGKKQSFLALPFGSSPGGEAMMGKRGRAILMENLGLFSSSSIFPGAQFLLASFKLHRAGCSPYSRIRQGVVHEILSPFIQACVGCHFIHVVVGQKEGKERWRQCPVVCRETGSKPRRHLVSHCSSVSPPLSVSMRFLSSSLQD